MLRVLLIEDNPGDAFLIKQMLEEVDDAGIHLNAVVDRLSKGLELLATTPFDVVLADLSLPDATGMETITRLLPHTAEIPIVVLTGMNDETVAIDAVRNGAQDYLVKGQVTGHLIARALNYAVERKRTALKEQRYLRNLASLSEAAMGFVGLNIDDDIYDFIGRQLQDLVGDAIVIINSFDEQVGAFRLHSLLGVDEQLNAVTTLLGCLPTELNLTPDEYTLAKLTSGKLEKVTGGLYPILFGQVSESVCRQIEEICQVGEIYAAGFAQKSGVLGDAVIILRRGNELRNQPALEIFINLASVALQRRDMECELRTQSVIDELTSLYNRRGFFTLAEQHIKIASRNKRAMLLLFIDVDNLKWINDALGHQFGDQALTEISGYIKETFRSSDILARIGGDEFVALVIDAHEGDAEILQHRLQERIASSTSQEYLGYRLAVSTGVAYYSPFDPCTIDDLLRQADSTMYEHKRSKRKVLVSQELP